MQFRVPAENGTKAKGSFAPDVSSAPLSPAPKKRLGSYTQLLGQYSSWWWMARMGTTTSVPAGTRKPPTVPSCSNLRAMSGTEGMNRSASFTHADRYGRLR